MAHDPSSAELPVTTTRSPNALSKWILNSRVTPGSTGDVMAVVRAEKEAEDERK
jgi:hypothetical protein